MAAILCPLSFISPAMSEDDCERQEQEAPRDRFDHDSEKYKSCCCACQIHCTTLAQIFGFLILIISFANIGITLQKQEMLVAIFNTIQMFAAISLVTGICAQAIGPVRLFLVWTKICLFLTFITVLIVIGMGLLVVSGGAKRPSVGDPDKIIIGILLIIFSVALQMWLIFIVEKVVHYLKDYENYCRQYIPVPKDFNLS